MWKFISIWKKKKCPYKNFKYSLFELIFKINLICFKFNKKNENYDFKFIFLIKK